jgi:hypothetical protein
VLVEQEERVIVRQSGTGDRRTAGVLWRVREKPFLSGAVAVFRKHDRLARRAGRVREEKGREGKGREGKGREGAVPTGEPEQV